MIGIGQPAVLAVESDLGGGTVGTLFHQQEIMAESDAFIGEIGVGRAIWG